MTWDGKIVCPECGHAFKRGEVNEARILEALGNGCKYYQDLVEKTNLSQPTVSKYLRMLEAKHKVKRQMVRKFPPLSEYTLLGEKHV